MSAYPDAEIAAALFAGQEVRGIEIRGFVLFSARERALFFPAEDRAAQEAALAAFSNSAGRRWAGAALLQLRRWTKFGCRPARLMLPAAWREQFGAKLEAAALYCGSPGPLQKVTVHIPSVMDGRSGVVVKLALRPTADAAIRQEVDCARKLARLPAELHDRVPHFLANGRLPSGREYVVMAAVRGRPGPSCLPDRYLGFLSHLATATRADSVWQCGAASMRTRQDMASLGQINMNAPYRIVIQSAWAAVNDQLFDKLVPHVLVHGDFTRFNTRQLGGSFVVFDWEHFRTAGNPLHDLLHYTVSQARNRREAETAVRAALAGASQYVANTFQGWTPTQQDIEALVILFLIDTLITYAKVDKYLNLRSGIVRTCIDLLQTRQSWCIGMLSPTANGIR